MSEASEPTPPPGPRGGRGVRIVMGILLPLAMTTVAAVLGYAIAVYPTREHVRNLSRIETLGPLVPDDPAFRERLLGAYFEDSGLDVDSFENVAWSVRPVMTPFVGHAPAPGRHHNARIDARQFRGDRPLATPKPPETRRVFVVGASTAFSVGASSDARTVGGYLQSVLDESASDAGFEVFTFATPAWSSTHERIAIENRLSDLEPDVVVQLSGTADCLYGQYGQNVLWSRAFSDHYYFDLVNQTLERAGLDRMKDVQDVSPGPVPAATVAARFEKNARLAAAALALVDARLHVFLQPDVFSTRKSLTAREEDMVRPDAPQYLAEPEYYRGCAAEIARRLGAAPLPPNVEFTNLQPVFDGLPDTEEIFLDSFHFGDRGNLAIARALAEAIR